MVRWFGVAWCTVVLMALIGCDKGSKIVHKDSDQADGADEIIWDADEPEWSDEDESTDSGGTEGSDRPDGTDVIGHEEDDTPDGSDVTDSADVNGTGSDANTEVPDEDSAEQATIYKIKLGEITPGTVTTIEGVVTGLRNNVFFVQVPEVAHDPELAYTYSGIFVYVQNGASVTMPTVGDLVTVAGTVQNYYGNIQLSTITAITVLGSGVIPEPVVVAPADVKTGGVLEKAYNGVLVTVEDVTVLDTSLGYGEFLVTGNLRVDDMLFTYTFPPVGTVYESLTGIMHYSFDNAKLEPRSIDDMVVATVPDGDAIPTEGSDATDSADVSDTGSDADSETPDGDTPLYEETFCAALVPPAEGLCTAPVVGDGNLRLRGIVLAPDRILRGGEVLVGVGGDIICVGCDCSNEPEAAGATVVECAEGVISPALINAHDHLGWTHNAPANWGTERYDHRHDWRIPLRGHTKISAPGGASTEQKQWGELRNVMAGTTIIAGSGGASGFLRNVDQNFFNTEGLTFADVYYNTFPLGDSNGTLLSSGCAYPNIDSSSVLNNDCYLPHVSEGIDAEARNEFLCLSSSANGGVDLTAANSAFIHLVGLTAQDALELAQNGTAHIWSPRTNISLYGNTAPVTLFHTLGVLIGMGTDWTPTGSINMLRELKCADYLNAVHFGSFFTARDLWRMTTINNAVALRLAALVGSLSVGKFADIAIFNGTGYEDDPYQAIVDANVDDVALVLRGGLPLYGDSDLMAVVPGSQSGCETLSVCGVTKSVCIQRETGKTYAELAAANSTAYSLFFCGTPTNEPTCVPMRTSADDTHPYNGPTATDRDGDGIADTSDNCPAIFNPIRPVDNGIQADADGDGIGDACDPTPLDTEPTINPNDKDGDGVPNSEDNCPYVANNNQEDSDGDGIGDACDPCPNTPNPLFGSCGVIPIYDLKNGTVMPGNTVETRGIVTAVSGSNFFIQVPEDEHDPVLGYAFSGIYVYNAPTSPQVGDVVTVTGTLQDYYGLLEIASVTTVQVESSANPLPTPVVVTPADIATGGQYADDYNAVLVRVDGVTVLDTSLGYGEFLVTGNLRIDDLLYAYPLPTIGDQFETITGILFYGFSNSKLEPRSAADMVKVQVTCGGEICDAWEECISDTCVPQSGRCNGDGDCADPTPVCNTTTHFCESNVWGVPNGDFETWSGASPDLWSADSGVGVEKESTIVHSGSAAVKLTRLIDINAETDFMSDYIPITAGVTYTVSGWFYDNNPDGSGRLVCHFYDAAKTYLASTYDADYTANSTTWQEMTMTCSNTTASYVRVGTRIYKGSGPATGGFVYLDDVTITAP